MTDKQMIDYLQRISKRPKYATQSFLTVAFRFGQLLEENKKLKNIEIETIAQLRAENQRLQTSLDSTKMCAEATVAGLTERIRHLEAARQ